MTNDWAHAYVSLVDRNTNEFYLFDTTRKSFQKVSFISRSTSPYFDWASRVTNVVTSYEGNLIGFSKTERGFAIRSSSSDNDQRCVNMMLSADSITEVSHKDHGESKDTKSDEFLPVGWEWQSKTMGTEYDVSEF